MGGALAILAMALGSAAITRASLGYFGEDMPPFVIEKLPVPFEEMWLRALRVHVTAAAFCLPACLLLLSTAALRRVPRLHRWLGRVTALAVMLLLLPSGFYLSVFAKAGVLSTAGFMLSGLIVGVAMVQGVRTARARRFAEHRRWALHVVAQLSVAVTSRAMLFALDAASVEADLAYLLSLWLPVVGSALAVELLSPRRTHAQALDHRRHPAPRHIDVVRVPGG